ncbi:polysaccharide deacetylase family protein [Desulfitobacterium metallireducens]|uniref:Polysaccharide deacetylase n=1 Tax=Desulfitobacterium metallireducens DSM 15288 TaxID=871968 RepID=W0EA20_9FIRM|nr:polysaccharide deacetylase family protein [Desulfitobacterium metallireducens]AHF06079.1 polysaccharide deacetylase [Desulfitobacterium metallireducens DSM 15288]
MNHKRYIYAIGLIIGISLLTLFFHPLLSPPKGSWFNTASSEPPQEQLKEQESQNIEPNPIKPTSVKLSAFPAEGIPVLMYHSISTIPGNNLGVPVEQFAEEMKWLKSQEYTTLSLEDFYQALVNNKPVPEKPILITFDDGYSDNYQSAWPILHENGFSATFFIITNSVGPDMMTWEQLTELTNQGNSIASHTQTHPDLSIISSQQLEKELVLSKKDLENHLGGNVEALCFPSSRYNTKTLEMMPRLGYKLGFTTNPGRVHLGDNPLTLKRIRIPGGMSLTSFQQQFK